MSTMLRYAVFSQQNPDIAQWLDSNGHNSFAVSLKQYAEKHGNLTERQIDAVRGIVQRASLLSPDTKTINVDKLTAAFDRARKTTKKKPIFFFSNFYAYESSSSSAICFKQNGTKSYLGKIKNGQFLAEPNCSDELKDEIIATMADPIAEAIKYGQKTGRCTVCGRTLTDGESIKRGIGPICADKFGY